MTLSLFIVVVVVELCFVIFSKARAQLVVIHCGLYVTNLSLLLHEVLDNRSVIQPRCE